MAYNTQDRVSDQIEDTAIMNSSSCVTLVSNLGFKCMPFTNAHNCEADQYKDYIWLKNLYLLNAMVNNHLLMFIVNVTQLVIFLYAQSILLNIIQVLNH